MDTQTSHNSFPPKEISAPLTIEGQMPPEHEPKTIGPIIGSLIILVMLIIGALYFWGQKLNSEERNKVDTTTTDIQAIRSDLNSTKTSVNEINQ